MNNFYNKLKTKSKMLKFNLIFNFKLFIYNYILNKFNDSIESIESHSLNYMIESRFTIKYFDLIMNICALNPKTEQNLYKLWVKFLISSFFLLGLIKCLILLQISSVDHYKMCVYLGDVSILFPSLRKFTLISIICTLTLAILIIYVFNYNHNNEWYEIFECFQGKSSPKLAGFKSKIIMVRMFILTKITFKIVQIVIFGLTEITWLIGAQILIRKFYKKPIKMHQIWKLLDLNLLKIPIDELISWIFWLPPTGIAVLVLLLIILTSNYLFQLICYHCFLTAKHLNGLISNLDFDLHRFNFRRKFLIKSRIRYIIKQYNDLSNQIVKYNQFWNQFYLSIVTTILPGNLFAVQQILFGKSINLDIRFMLIIFSIIGFSIIVLPSLLVCFLANEIKKPYKSLIKFQHEKRLGINIHEKIKVIFQLIKPLI